MRLLTWNVQWCRGVDGKVDPVRIAASARATGADVLCLQEVAVGFADLPGSTGENQVQILEKELPGYAAFFAGAVDLPAEGAPLQVGGAFRVEVDAVADRLPGEHVVGNPPAEAARGVHDGRPAGGEVHAAVLGPRG